MGTMGRWADERAWGAECGLSILEANKIEDGNKRAVISASFKLCYNV